MEHYTFPQPVGHNRIIDLDEGYDVPKYKWLRKLLKRLGLLKRSHYYHYYETYETVTISAPRMRGMIRQFMNSIARNRHPQPTKLYIGRLGYRMLTDELYADRITSQISWPVKVYGMEVIITPYLDNTKFLPVFD